jgi:DNA-binding Xre family transcriptional regulator
MVVCRLRKILRKKGLTRSWLQQKTGISYPTLHSLYHDRNKKYDRVILNRLCYALKCNPGDLLQWKPDRFPRLAGPSQSH